MSDSFVPSRALGVLIALLIAAAWLADIGHRVLQHPDEGRYAEIAREMAATGDWVTPRLNGLKYFEKPPLQYWLTAASFDAFGVSEWSARLWPALAGLIGVVAIAWAGACLGGMSFAWTAGLALAGMLWQIALSQILTLDALLGAFLAIGFAAFVVAQRTGSTDDLRRRAMWLTFAAMAGATLTKGLIGIVLPGGALVLYTLIARDFTLWRRLHLRSGLLIYFALTAPWFVLVSARNPQFASFFFVHEHFQRFLTTTHRRTGSVFYFVPLLLAGAMPWIVLLLACAHRAWRDGTPNALGFSWQRFALVWSAFVFVFFSASSSKLPSYILPMFAPLALVAGWLLLRLSTRDLLRVMAPVVLIGIALAVAAITAYWQIAAPFTEEKQASQALLSFGVFVKVALAFASLGGMIGWLLLRRGSPRARFAAITTFALSTLVATQVIVAGLDSFRHTRSAYDILREASAASDNAAAMHTASIPFYQVRMYDQTVPFYLRRTTRTVEFEDELALGIEAEPELAVDTVEHWLPEWRDIAEGFAIMSSTDYDALTRIGLPMKLLARDGRRAIVSRR